MRGGSVVLIDEDKAKQLVIMGTDIGQCPPTFSHSSGWPGDVWLDEFAWVRNQRC